MHSSSLAIWTEHPIHRLIVHDWSDHADETTHTKLARKTLSFADGCIPKSRRLNEDERKRFNAWLEEEGYERRKPGRPKTNAAETQGKCRGNAAETTKPGPEPGPEPCSSTKPNSVEEPTLARLSSSDGPLPPAGEVKSHTVEVIYQAYPRKVGKRAALTAIRKAIDRIVGGERGQKEPNRLVAARWLSDVVQRYAKSKAGQRNKFTPHPSTWFHQSRYLDDPAEWERDEQDKPTPKPTGQKDYRSGLKNGGGWGVDTMTATEMTNSKHEIHGVCDMDGHGPFVSARWIGCPKCWQEQHDQFERESAIREVERRVDSAAVPLRFRGKFLESFQVTTPKQEAVVEIVRGYITNFPEHYAAGRCLVLMGSVGTGKTLLVSLIIQSLIGIAFLTGNKERPGYTYWTRYTTAAEVIQKIRDTWWNKTSTTAVIERFGEYDLLIIDEVGSRVGTDSERGHLFDVIDRRYRDMHPTVVVSNCDREELTRVLGEQAIDRLRDHGGLLALCDWPSWRK